MAQTLSEQQLQQLWVKAGGDPKAAPMMAKLAIRESGGKAHINNAGLNKNGSIDYGLWQINSVHGYNPQKLYDPLYNAKAAVAVYKAQGPKAWATYNPAVDKKYIGAALKGGSYSTPSSTGAVQQNPVGGGGADIKKQIALSLLGFGGLGNDTYGSDPLTLALTQAVQNRQQPQTQAPAPTQSHGGGTQKGGGGAVTFDGKPVVGWMAPILERARKTGLWKGSVTSGIRTKAQQLQAAKNYGLQHYPHGPLASNHVEGHNGAVDVSDPEGLKRALRAIHNNRLKSSMPEDPVHFSGTGY